MKQNDIRLFFFNAGEKMKFDLSKNGKEAEIQIGEGLKEVWPNRGAKIRPKLLAACCYKNANSGNPTVK